jgi:hypothetical protein
MTILTRDFYGCNPTAGKRHATESAVSASKRVGRGSLLEIERERADPGRQVIQDRGRGLGGGLLACPDRLYRAEFLQDRAVVTVDHDAEEFARLAEDKIAARRSEVSEQPFKDPIVHPHIPRMGRIELEAYFPLAASSSVDLNGFGELVGIRRQRVGFDTHRSRDGRADR